MPNCNNCGLKYSIGLKIKQIRISQHEGESG